MFRSYCRVQHKNGGLVSEGAYVGVLGKQGLSTGRAQQIAGARRAPQAGGRFSTKESGVSQRVCVCLRVCERGSASECRAVQGRFHGWLITGVHGSTLTTAARPCRQTRRPPPLLSGTKGALPGLAQHGPARQWLTGCDR